ncbi:MAG: DUF488 domain-containing protein [Deltaproteobacteria bacterium]|nr:MAG: DUF488 domain-containing protein [Deltaproteobacteria bacterium]
MKTVYSIGHSNRSIEEFLALLKQNNIKILIDIRSFPVSKWKQFRKENLSCLLSDNGYQYVYLGKELGGFRKGGYERYTRTEEFNKGLKELETYALINATAFMCAERFPWRCHRRYISRELEEMGWRVIHIIDKDKAWIPKNKI